MKINQNKFNLPVNENSKMKIIQNKLNLPVNLTLYFEIVWTNSGDMRFGSRQRCKSHTIVVPQNVCHENGFGEQVASWSLIPGSAILRRPL